MTTDDELHDALERLEPPEIDLDRDLGRVHRRVNRARMLRIGGPVAAVVLILAVSLAVISARGEQHFDVEVISAHVARATTTPAQAKAGATAVNAFSLDLFKKVAGDTPGNLVLSPYSVDEVLSMAFAGAGGTTHDQIANVLHAGADEGDYHQALNALDRQLTAPREGRAKGPDPKNPGKKVAEAPPVELQVADSVWVQRGFAVEHAFLDRLARSYGAGVHTVDFATQADTSRKAINAWVSEHTGGRIKDLLAKGDIDEMTRLVLVNAVTFEGRWSTPFDDPTPGTFTTGSGTTVTTPMMDSPDHLTDGASGPGWRSASIPYVGGAHMLVILPNDIDSYVKSLTPQLFDSAAKTDGAHAWLSVKMPTFELTSHVELGDSLEALGMPDAFEPGRADFSGIDGRRDLSVGAVVHQAHIKVDPQGTKAEAATAMGFLSVGAAIGPGPLVLDHPFLYAVVDDASGAILFIGRVDNPTTKS